MQSVIGGSSGQWRRLSVMLVFVFIFRVGLLESVAQEGTPNPSTVAMDPTRIITVLSTPEYQEDLRFSEDQRSLAEETLLSFRQAVLGLTGAAEANQVNLAKPKDQDTEETPIDPIGLAKQTTFKKLIGSLSIEQSERLQQIYLQDRLYKSYSDALLHPWVREKIALTPDQVEKIELIDSALNRTRNDLIKNAMSRIQGLGADHNYRDSDIIRDELRARLTELSVESSLKARATLQGDQALKLEEISGRPAPALLRHRWGANKTSRYTSEITRTDKTTIQGNTVSNKTNFELTFEQSPARSLDKNTNEVVMRLVSSKASIAMNGPNNAMGKFASSAIEETMSAIKEFDLISNVDASGFYLSTIARDRDETGSAVGPSGVSPKVEQNNIPNTPSAGFAMAKKNALKSRASHLTSSFYCSFAVFPRERVAIGQSWEVVDTIDKGRGRIKYKYTWQGNRFVDGIHCCEIAVEAIAMAGRVDQSVAEKLDQGNGVIFFDRVAGQVVQCKFNSNISIGSGGNFSTQSTETLDFKLSRGEMTAPK